MAGKRKNRKKSKSSQKDLKVLAARYKNEFLGRAKSYIDLWLGENTSRLLPYKEANNMYIAHFTPPRLESGCGSRISKKLLWEFKEMINLCLDSYTVEISESIPKISLKHFLTYYLTISCYLKRVKENQFLTAKELKEKWKKLDEKDEKIMNQGFNCLNEMLVIISWMFSDPQKCFYWVSCDYNKNTAKNKGLYFLIKINAVKPVVEEFIVNGDKRPAYKFGVPKCGIGIIWQKLKPPAKGSFRWKNELEIFIQSHAFNRLYERVDFINDIFLCFNLYLSLIKPRMIYENNFILIPYKVFNVTVGYFIADISQHKILLRTFLFLTNEGTPEARRLKEITGLNKLDVKYLNIDKISTFIESDIVKNEWIKNIFIEAGCGGLFELKFAGSDAYSGKVKLAEEMRKYLEIESENEKDSVDENDKVKSLM